MMRHFILGLLLVLGPSVQAAYVTDKLVAGLYEKAEVTDKPLKALTSGTPLEVISRDNGFIKVTTPDGTTGYIEAAYLTDEKPARSMLLELQAKNAQLQQQLEPYASATADADAPGLSLEQVQAELSASQQEMTSLQAQVRALEQENSGLKQQQEKLVQQRQQIAEIVGVSVAPAETAVVHTSANPENGLLSGEMLTRLLLAVFLLVGFAGGVMLMRYRIRKRFGTVLRL